MKQRRGQLWGAALLLATACGDDGGGADATDAGQVLPDAEATGGSGGAGGSPVGGSGGAPPGGTAPDAGPPPVEPVRIQGNTADVRVDTDALGMLHVRCEVDSDCVAAQGYYHAAHRFSQMDINRRFAQGKLSELVGTVTIETDKDQRGRLTTRDGLPVAEQIYASSSPATRALFDAYTRGVNAFIDDLKNSRNGAKLQDEYDFPLINKARIDPWTPVDSAAVTLLLIDDLTNSAESELNWARLMANLPMDLAYDLYAPLPAEQSDVLGAANGGPPSQTTTLRTPWWRYEASHARLTRFASVLNAAADKYGEVEQAPVGSNNWVIGPAQTQGGAALLSNDPHLALTNPSIWYLVHLHSSQADSPLNVAGVSLAGLPGVVIGQNENIAWGMTTTYFDQTDVYLETLSPDGEGVLLDGEVVPFIKRTHQFEVFGQDEVTTDERLYVPHHGPVLSIDREAGTAVSFRWTGQEATTDADFLFTLARASNVDEARTALRSLTTIGQNVVVIDRGGNFGWFPYNHVPTRPWASPERAPWLPVPGDGTAEWGPYVPYEELPQALNPASGYIATANNDMTGHLDDADATNDDQAALQAYPADGFRHSRIVQRLEGESGRHTLASQESIVNDVYVLIADRILPTLLSGLDAAVVELTPDGQKTLEALSTWDYQCLTGLDGASADAAPVADPAVVASAIGCSAFHVLFDQLRTQVFNDEIAAEGGAEGQFARMQALSVLVTRPGDLARGDAYWDDVSTEDRLETRADTVVTALNGAGTRLVALLGDDPQGWLWGRIHTLTFVANLFDDAGVADFNHGPFANDGGMETVDVASPIGPRVDIFEQRAGASMRFQCEAVAERPVQCRMQFPGGQQHFRDSDFYEHMVPKYLRGEGTDIALTSEAVDAASVVSSVVTP
ncbi:MAG: penicillin acylase family protein [Bradymonadia bacterium]